MGPGGQRPILDVGRGLVPRVRVRVSGGGARVPESGARALLPT